MNKPLLSIRNLNAVSRRDGKPILRDVSLDVAAGSIHGLVGESGAGKSTISKVILGILSRGVIITSGSVTLAGRDLLGGNEAERRKLIGSEVGLIPQDPLTALNPGRRVGEQLIDSLRLWRGLSSRAAWQRGLELLDQVAIREPERVMKQFPHHLSGGMRQRVLIAAAFSIEPRLLIADEPTTALDVTVQKQVLLLLKQMQAEHGTAVVFVTHDLGVVAQICDEVTLLFQGKVMERGGIDAVFHHPQHAYTRALLAASPRYDDPAAGLHPIDDAIIAACRAEIAQFDGARHA
ncbi:ABC transporter ATP-binding protein [Devosia sp. 63-57]|uniref:ABC transporter ATP-binding protein n=1 Tax=Devosia sp. 63-57 TaxID=1895751 RepID=UPI00086BE17E|nr:ABC transporter ATP-binding protein [Devosia sp. 63-57]ODT47207.1 MAG: ABC transporter ATP-binding protein [Pelagibacterium sp. SCN 63-126]ODU89023.1 MAG: ABC transporter ATP-binding protein [Pelagibacterium sp. SCN 63-17]OJX43081.1 MAG: ABC transporter ATP-binding protein [Devosia sp. 63-57]